MTLDLVLRLRVVEGDFSDSLSHQVVSSSVTLYMEARGSRVSHVAQTTFVLLLLVLEQLLFLTFQVVRLNCAELRGHNMICSRILQQLLVVFLNAYNP